MELAPPETGGEIYVMKVMVTADRSEVAYQTNKMAGDLYLIHGVK
jgi:hypothetical protein